MKSYMKIVGVFTSMCWGTFSIAQQQAQYTQYMYNTIEVNAGYTGSKDHLEAALLHRSQWVSAKGAPMNQAFSIQGKMKNNVGLGLTLTNDNIGPSNDFTIQTTVAYHLNLNYDTRLSLGINAGADFLSIDWSKGEYLTENDPSFTYNSRVRPVAGAGLYLYNEKWYVGLSVPNFIQGDFYNDESSTIVERDFHNFLIAGYVFDLSNKVKFKPSTMLKYVFGAPITVDVSASFLFNEKLTAGIGYRFHDAVNFLLGYQITDRFFGGYSYDATVTNVRNYNSGSHEIILRYNLQKKKAILRSPRFF